MGSPTFQFKQFTIAHDRCAMKVGTDGVLVGAWAELPATGKVLDIGTGSGLIALMAAQRSPGIQVTGIDIVREAVEQARENVAASPFHSRVEIRLQSLQELAATDERFDAIVCNPPFFEETLLPPEANRSLARHVESLSFESLVAGTDTLLRADGCFSTILPTTAFDRFRQLCVVSGLYLKRFRRVQGTARKAPKRVLATFGRKLCTWEEESPLILNDNGGRSKDYAALTDEFYLW